MSAEWNDLWQAPWNGGDWVVSIAFLLGLATVGLGILLAALRRSRRCPSCHGRPGEPCTTTRGHQP